MATGKGQGGVIRFARRFARPCGLRGRFVVWGETTSLDHLGGVEDTLWQTNIAMERSTMFNGKIHYFYGNVQ